MGTIIQELQRLLTVQKARGNDRAWLAPETLRAFYQLPAASLTAAPAAPPHRPAPPQQPPMAQQPQPSAITPSQPQPPAPRPAAMPAATPAAPAANQPLTARPAAQPHYVSAQTAPAAPRPAAAAAPQTTSRDFSALGWDELQQAAMACQACRLCPTRQHVVFEDGCRQARVMFIGEGPGEDEDRQGVPFVGRAGQLLTRIILAMGLDRTSPDPAKAAYIANIVKCRPPRNRNPEPDEGTVCLPFLRRQIELVKPEVIVLLGNVPLTFLMGKSGITRLRGQWLQYGSIPVMPTFHPAYLLRFEAMRERFIEEKRKVWQDMQQVMAKLGLKRPV